MNHPHTVRPHLNCFFFWSLFSSFFDIFRFAFFPPVYCKCSHYSRLWTTHLNSHSNICKISNKNLFSLNWTLKALSRLPNESFKIAIKRILNISITPIHLKWPCRTWNHKIVSPSTALKKTLLWYYHSLLQPPRRLRHWKLLASQSLAF